MREVVGAMIGTVVTNCAQDIRNAIIRGEHVRILYRDEMEFLAACDLGENWKDMSVSKTLFAETE